MQFFNTFKRRNGSYSTVEFSAQEMLNFDILRLGFIAVLFSFLSVLLSGACLLYRLWDYDTDDKSPSFIGIVTATYFLIDYHKAWLVSFILGIFEDETTMKFIAHCNLAILITHIFLLVFGDTVFFNAQGDLSYRKTLVAVLSGVCLVVTYLITIPLFN